MSNPALWAVLLIATAFVLIVVEIFVPSGGVIGFIAALAMVAGIILVFMEDTTWGLISAAICLTAIPFLIGFGIKVWPDTPIGRFLSLNESQATQTRSARGDDTSGDKGDSDLLGATGRAVTDLRPIGTCLINDRRVECISSRGVIESGAMVKIVSVDGLEVKVTPVQDAT